MAALYKISGGVKLDPATLKATGLPVPEPDVTIEAPTYVTFDRDRDFTIGDGNRMLPWHSRASESKSSIKWGQFKLLMEEIQFLTLYWDPDKIPTPTVVYVGSAIGTHIDTMTKLFPSIKWQLYDPRDHDRILYGNSQITIHKQFFTDEDAKRYAERKDVFFITDLRSSDYSRSDKLDTEQEYKNESLVANDMDMQMRWTKIIRPVKASLKFRLPYSYGWLAEVSVEGKARDAFMARFPWITSVKNGLRTYLDGLVFIQQWGPLTTTETRLVPHDELATRDWDHQAHEEMMFYHNTQVREKQQFINPITGDRTDVAGRLGLLSDYDSVATTVIAMEYLQKFGVDTNVSRTVAFLNALILGANKGQTDLLGLRIGGKAAKLLGDEDND